MKKLLRNKKGFTLIELIVVIAILAILALILVPSILNYVGEATISRDQANARSIYSQVSLELATDADNTIAVGDLDTEPAGCDITGPTDDDVIEDGFTVTCGAQTFNGTDFN